MKKPFLTRSSAAGSPERGATIVLVALAMVAIIAMAALSIDVITLYLAREEAQHSADTAALAAARILSISGVTGDPANSQGGLSAAPWPTVCAQATQVATAVANQNTIGGAMPNTVTVTFVYNGATVDCSAAGANTSFTVNPQVQVQVVRQGLPNFFSRLWGNTGTTVSASASAEAFNPSNSESVGSSGTLIPVQPRCVKPWVVPNQDPMNPAPTAFHYCNQSGGPGACQPLVSVGTGSISHPGISLGGTGANGIIGETFWLSPDCRWSQSHCVTRITPPQPNYNNGSGYMQGPPNLVFVPAQVGTTTPTAVPSCATGNDFEEAVAGCDSAQNYSCGVSGNNVVDLSRYPDASNARAVSCLINQADTTDVDDSTGQDYLNASGNPFGAPSVYPFQILAGSANPLALPTGSPVSVSSSIVSLPIYDQATPITSGTTAVTFVGFLQVFINAVDQYGNVNVTVLNVAGCSNGGGVDVSPSPVSGTSPVPVRLITPP